MFSAPAIQETGWSMEGAIEYYYTMNVTQQASKARQQPGLCREAVEQLFNRYRDQHAQAILAEGVGRLCEDLQVALPNMCKVNGGLEKIEERGYSACASVSHMCVIKELSHRCSRVSEC